MERAEQNALLGFLTAHPTWRLQDLDDAGIAMYRSMLEHRKYPAMRAALDLAFHHDTFAPSPARLIELYNVEVRRLGAAEWQGRQLPLGKPPPDVAQTGLAEARAALARARERGGFPDVRLHPDRTPPPPNETDFRADLAPDGEEGEADEEPPASLTAAETDNARTAFEAARERKGAA